jgi:hypothetical protein
MIIVSYATADPVVVSPLIRTGGAVSAPYVMPPVTFKISTPTAIGGDVLFRDPMTGELVANITDPDTGKIEQVALVRGTSANG